MSDIKTWRKQLEEVGGYENELACIPAGGVGKMVDRIEELEAEQVETRRKHREDYEALHDAVAQVATLRAELAALEGQKPAAIAVKQGAYRQFMSERLGHLQDGTYNLYLAAGAREAQPMTDAEKFEASMPLQVTTTTTK